MYTFCGDTTCTYTHTLVSSPPNSPKTLVGPESIVEDTCLRSHSGSKLKYHVVEIKKFNLHNKQNFPVK